MNAIFFLPGPNGDGEILGFAIGVVTFLVTVFNAGRIFDNFGETMGSRLYRTELGCLAQISSFVKAVVFAILVSIFTMMVTYCFFYALRIQSYQLDTDPHTIGWIISTITGVITVFITTSLLVDTFDQYVWSKSRSFRPLGNLVTVACGLLFGLVVGLAVTLLGGLLSQVIEVLLAIVGIAIVLGIIYKAFFDPNY